MRSYAKALARDIDGAPMQEYPAPVIALAQYNRENATASSVISVTHDTTALEVAAVGGTAALKWITTGDTGASVVTAVSGANFDHVVSSGEVRRFVIPIESFANMGGSVVGINRGAGLYQRVAIKSAGAASSVLLSEY